MEVFPPLVKPADILSVSSTDPSRTGWQPWAMVVVAVFMIKVVFLLLDATPQFFLGDSISYLYTAQTGWIPPDRSFAYGFLLRVLALLPASFVPLLWVQSAATGATALMAFGILRYFANVRFPLALAAALIIALDPFHLYYERNVMTDVLAMFLMASYCTAALWIYRKPRLDLLAAFQVLSVLVISMRTSFVPLVFVVSMGVLGLALWERWQKAKKAAEDRRKVVAASLVLVLGVCGFLWLFHSGYKRLNGYLSGNPPAYQYADGLFTLSFLSPILEPQDARDPHLAELIRQPPTPLIHAYRNYQLFGGDGLVERLRPLVPPDQINAIAKETAMAALRRDPLGAAGVGYQTYLQYFENPVRQTLEDDNNLQFNRTLPDDFRVVLQEKFGLETTPDWLKRPTVAKDYLMALRGWIYLLLITPFVALGGVFVTTGWRRVLCGGVALVAITLLAVHCTLAPHVTRYLLLLGFMLPVVLAVLVDSLWLYQSVRRSGLPSSS